MDDENQRVYEAAVEGALSNELLTKWLISMEERLRKLEASQSLRASWGVSQDELAETKSEDDEE